MPTIDVTCELLADITEAAEGTAVARLGWTVFPKLADLPGPSFHTFHAAATQSA